MRQATASPTATESFMGVYPAHLARRRRLADGRSVTVRPIRAEDEDAERRFLDALSAETRHLRFFDQACGAGSERLAFLTRIDYDRHMAFVCESEDGSIVGNARYVVNADQRSCEFGVVVADAWHHTGVAQLLMDALTRAASARRLETMEGLVMSENTNMLKFAHSLGFTLSPDSGHPALVRAVLRL